MHGLLTEDCTACTLLLAWHPQVRYICWPHMQRLRSGDLMLAPVGTWALCGELHLAVTPLLVLQCCLYRYTHSHWRMHHKALIGISVTIRDRFYTLRELRFELRATWTFRMCSPNALVAHMQSHVDRRFRQQSARLRGEKCGPCVSRYEQPWH